MIDPLTEPNEEMYKQNRGLSCRDKDQGDEEIGRDFSSMDRAGSYVKAGQIDLGFRPVRNI